MPIYEFYCERCHTIFNFFSKTVNTEKLPDCPKCNSEKLTRRMSLFAVTGKAKDDAGMDDLPFDESKMEKAMDMLARNADSMNTDDPKQAAQIMRKLTDMTGLKLRESMEDALRRMERGEDPDQIEAEMGDVMEDGDPFLMPNKKGKPSGANRPEPFRDDTLYDL